MIYSALAREIFFLTNQLIIFMSRSQLTTTRNEFQSLATQTDLARLAIPCGDQQLISREQLDYISGIPVGSYWARGVRSWCLKEEALLPTGQTLVHFSTSHRPAGFGSSSADALYIKNPDGSVAGYLGFKSSHNDSEFGIKSDSVVRAIDGKIFLAKRDVIESFGMRDANGNPLLPDSDDSIREVSEGAITQNGQNIISTFRNLTDFFKSRSASTGLVQTAALGSIFPAQDQPQIEIPQAPLPIADLPVADISVSELRDLMEFVPEKADGNKLISTNGVDVFLNGRSKQISVNRGTLPSGIASAGVYSKGDKFFNNISAGANVEATSGPGKMAVEELTRNKNSLLTKILFSIEDPNLFGEFLLTHAVEKNVSRELVDENGRNILHHLVESAQDQRSIAKANEFLEVLCNTLTSTQIQELALAGDAFHFKTPFSVAASNPNLRDLAARLIPFVGSSINQVDANGNTPLHWATIKHSQENSNLETIGNLIRAGANPNIVDSSVFHQSTVAVAVTNEAPVAAPVEAVGRRGFSFVERFSKKRVAPISSETTTATQAPVHNKCLPTILLGSLCTLLENREDLNRFIAKDESGRFYLPISTELQDQSKPSDQNLAFGFSPFSKSPYLEYTNSEGRVMHLAIKEDGSVGLYRNNTDRSKTEITDERSSPDALVTLISQISQKANVRELGGVECGFLSERSAPEASAAGGGRGGR